jgi:hypothetical protein
VLYESSTRDRRAGDLLIANCETSTGAWCVVAMHKSGGRPANREKAQVRTASRSSAQTSASRIQRNQKRRWSPDLHIIS